ncbi:unnamed protein product [Darwinula stevensoni]|uniref:Uncharacterized protein n=1 Tax=Darwinula stevensoni TaxID=69355 RepID=A0A7R9FND2_9CRUS|nr:unnamed protein product [Darwinula stevensoni]CAG0896565.1 unnamed protein product [Darwinula stevensoni]
MPIDLYYVLASPPCRSVMLLAKDLGVKLNLKLINPPAGDARTPEYLKINPQGTIPAMDDDGYILCESRAILRYLNNKFATDDRLYPLDLKARGMVDQRLDFDCGSFFPAFLNCVRPVFFGLTKTVSEEKKERNKEVMGLLDKFLETSGGYVAGKHLTLADYAFVAVAVSFEAFVPNGLQMPIDLYCVLGSPPSRSVLLLGKALGLEFNLIETSPITGATRTPEYHKMNPLHTIPTINDDGFALYESRAILRYLFNAYGKEKDEHLYPKDPKARAIVDQRLDFDIGTLAAKAAACSRPIVFGNATSISEEDKKNLKEALEILDGYIEASGGYCAGKHLTLADISIISVISSIEAVGVLDLSEMKHLSAWLAKCKTEMPGYEEANGRGAEVFGHYLRSKMSD